MTTTAQLVSAAEAANWSSFKSLVISATPADIAAIGSDWNTVMAAIATGVDSSAQAPKALFTSAMTNFFAAASPYLTGDSVADALDSIAQNSPATGTDHLSVEMIAIMNAVPASVAATASTFTLNSLLFDISNSQFNAEVTPLELKNTFAALTSKFGAQLDVSAVLSTVSALANNFPFSHADQLASVRVLLEASPANASSVNPFDLQNTLDSIGLNQQNPEVTPEELNSTLKVFVTHYGAATDVNAIISTASRIAGEDSFTGTDHLSAVRTLLAAEPDNQASADPFGLQDLLDNISRNQRNPEVTPEELNSTLKVFVTHYGAATDVNAIISTASRIAGDDLFTGTDHLSAVRTLLAAEPDNKTSANPFGLQDLLDNISRNQQNSEVTPEEFNNTFKVFATHYGAATDVNAIISTASRIAGDDSFTGTDHLSAVRTLLAAEPDNKASAGPFGLQDLLDNISRNQGSPEVTADELNSTLAVFTAHYGALTDVNAILDTVAQVAINDEFSGTDNFASVRTLLGAHPDNAAMVDPFSLSNALQAINGNNQNPGISEHELAQTLGKFMTAYGAFTPGADLANAIINDAQAEKYEAAGAIVNHLDAGQFATAAPDVNAFSTAQLLTTGNDTFSGASSDKLAVYGGAGNDTVDFSANASAAGRYLDGGAGKDLLTGGLGDDVLTGGAGADTLTGGDGADTFRFDRTGADHVTDFSEAQGDRIDLHDVLQGQTVLAVSDYVSLQSSGSNTILSVDTDGAGTAHGFVQVAQLDNTTGLDVNELYANGQIVV